MPTKKSNNQSGFCIPLIIYIILSIISIIRSINNKLKNSSKLISIIVNIIFHCLIGGFIYWLCSKCYNKTAWIVLLFPIIFIILFSAITLLNIGILSTINTNKKVKNNKKEDIIEHWGEILDTFGKLFSSSDTSGPNDGKTMF